MTWHSVSVPNMSATPSDLSYTYPRGPLLRPGVITVVIHQICIPNRLCQVSQPYVYVHTVDPPLPFPQQAPQPLHPKASPFSPAHGNVVRRRVHKGLGRRVDHFEDGGVEPAVVIRVRQQRRRTQGGRPGLEPIAAEVEEAAVGPVARGYEEDEEEDRAVDAGAVEEVRADEEEEDEGGRGVGGDEEEREPARHRSAGVSGD